MNREVPTGRIFQDKKRPSRSIPVTALITAVALLSPGLSYAAEGTTANQAGAGGAQPADAPAADGTITELRAENARLKAELEKSRHELAAQKEEQPADGSPALAPVAAAADPGNTADAAAPEKQSAELGTVKVRATRSRLSTLQDVPQSISLVTGDQLDQQDAEDLPAITKRLSNVTWNAGNSREFSLSIRGLGYESNTEAEDPSVLVTVDGVPYAYNPLASFDLVDLDTVEVAHGPQGTQGGKNADLGGIYIQTKSPTFKPETSFQVAYGGYTTGSSSISTQGGLGSWDRVIANAVVGGPVIDDLLAWRGTLSIDKGNGYIGNIYNTSQSYGNTDRVQGRLQFLLTPLPGLTARIKLDFKPSGGEYYNGMTIYTPTPNRYADGGNNSLATDASVRLARPWFSTAYPNYYTQNYLYGGGLNAVDNNSQQPLITRSHGATSVINYAAGDYLLSSITGFQQYYFLASNDEGTAFDVTTASGGGVDYHQFSQEFRLNSPEGGLVDYQTGLFLFSSSTQGAISVSKNGWGSDAGAWFASASQYTTLNADAAGQQIMQMSLDGLRKAGYEDTEKRQAALYSQLNWHISDPLTVTTGLRLSYEERRTSDNSLITANGYGAALNPAAVNGVILGGSASGIAQQFPGASPAEIAAAQALRLAQIGILWNTIPAQAFYKIQPGWVISPSYKFNQNLTGYISYQHGEKAGISQNTNGVSNLTPGETSTNYEVGLKTVLLDRTLTLNADIFYNPIKNYQQATQVFDVYDTNLNLAAGQTLAQATTYTSATGAVAKVHVKGLELDGVYTPNQYASFRFSGAYNDGIYYSFSNMGQPVENADQKAKYRDVSGQTLPGAARYTFNLGADLHYPFPFYAGHEAFLTFNSAYTSRYNSDNTGLSSYAWIHAHNITDLTVGVGRIDKRFDLSLLVKNLFDNTSPYALTWNSYTPAPPRWIGLQVSGKL